MNDTQLYLAIGVPLVVNVLGFTLVGLMLSWIKGDLRDVNTNLTLLTGKVAEMDNRLTRVEDKLNIRP